MLKLRGDCMVAGVREAEFWDMTPGEAVREIEALNERRKDAAFFAYTNAMAVGLFVGSLFNSSNKPPALTDIYPDLFPEFEEIEEQKAAESSVANFINFANNFNRNLNNGDRKSESENNG